MAGGEVESAKGGPTFCVGVQTFNNRSGRADIVSCPTRRVMGPGKGGRGGAGWIFIPLAVVKHDNSINGLFFFLETLDGGD